MNPREAIALIGDTVPPGEARRWADFGAGDGTFTRALAELLGSSGVVYAVDRDATALASIDSRPSSARARVVPVVADLARPLELPELGSAQLDGALFANSLHFIADAAGVLARLVSQVKPGGRVVIIEYDRREASRWVPYPIPRQALAKLAESAGLAQPEIVATRPSLYGGDLYVAVAERSAPK